MDKRNVTALFLIMFFHFQTLMAEEDTPTTKEELPIAENTLLTEEDKPMITDKTNQDQEPKILEENSTSKQNTSHKNVTPPKGLHIYIRKAQEHDVESNIITAYNALRTGQNEAAVYLYKKVLSSHPNNIDAMLGLAVSYQSNKEFANANKLYVKLLRRGNQEQYIIQNLAKSLYEQNSNQSLDILLQLHSAIPRSDVISSQIAIFYLKRNTPEKAIPFLQEAIKLSPHNILYYYNLGLALEKSGMPNKAQSTYIRALEILENKESTSSSMDSYSLIHTRLMSITSSSHRRH